MKVLLYGAGVIGSLHAWALGRAGHDVRLLVRAGHESRFARGLRLHVLDARGGHAQEIDESFRPRLETALTPADSYDAVILTVRWDQAESLLPQVVPRLGRANLLLFTNNWSGFDWLERHLAGDRYAFGLPHGGGVLASGVLDGALTGSVLLGSSARGRPTSPDQEEPEQEVVDRFSELFGSAGFVEEIVENMRDWYWVHFASTAVWGGAAAKAGTLSALAGDTAQIHEALLAGHEAMQVCRAREVDLRVTSEARTFLSPAWMVAGAVRRTLGQELVQRMSQTGPNDRDGVRRMYQEVLRTARELGVGTSHLERYAPFLEIVPLPLPIPAGPAAGR